MYHVKMMSGDILKIPVREFEQLGNAKGMVSFPSLDGGMINLNSVETILPEKIALGLQKKKQTAGRLHDGTKVIKKFGEWISLYSPDAKLDPSFYPEIAKDEVMSEEEWENQNEPAALPQPKPHKISI